MRAFDWLVVVAYIGWVVIDGGALIIVQAGEGIGCWRERRG